MSMYVTNTQGVRWNMVKQNPLPFETRHGGIQSSICVVQLIGIKKVLDIKINYEYLTGGSRIIYCFVILF